MPSKRILGIALIVAGIAFCLSLIGYQYFHCVNIWNHEPAKALTYSSASDYFFQVSKWAIAIGILGGGTLATIGGLLCKKK